MNPEDCPDGICCGPRSRASDERPQGSFQFKDSYDRERREAAPGAGAGKENRQPADGLLRVMATVNQLNPREHADCFGDRLRPETIAAMNRARQLREARTLGPALGGGSAACFSTAARSEPAQPKFSRYTAWSPKTPPYGGRAREPDSIAMLTPMSVVTEAPNAEEPSEVLAARLHGARPPPRAPLAAAAPVHHVEIRTPASVVTDCPSPPDEGNRCARHVARRVSSPEIFLNDAAPTTRPP
eukprot:CAMPEP_0204557916 /NCGR_PEP_ID=MMETSP0661-20131031/30700_1 /ASSEMBLY_ACC=CAM_ASM_000606 /TAXON_ID=109239 /ORGANISM="Alexandrium margalefi, Strain AMGDE01CS-322" /LENGTH=241 /DNA_ID=CAMNT_0051565059 /DNA_START=24 /DNA_END=745 /DNA_ORIENTATION=+